MDILGIEFEPLTTPLKRRIETISAFLSFTGMTLLFGIGFSLNIYILLFTRFWIIALIYFAWIWIDIPTTEKGGRRSDWVRGWRLFKYAADYYPVSLITQPNMKLDPLKNYIFCGYPHAIFPSGTILSLATKARNIDKVFPDHTIYSGTLDVNLKAPLYKDFLMSIGFCSVSAKSLNYILNHPQGGRIALIIVGGAAEAYMSYPDNYKIILKNRKGFVKLAIKNGTPLVPVYSFGEMDAFDQYVPPHKSWIHKFQVWIKDAISITAPVFYGRGVFQKSFGLIPRSNPIHVVVGNPIDVVKNLEPSKEEIEKLHQVFVDAIVNLFEEYKHKYIEDADNKHLIIV